jgi:gluconate 2-dehydrogenase gamma chain
MPISRRDWIFGSVRLALLPQVLRAQDHARKAAKAISNGHAIPFEYLEPEAARSLVALAAEIIPSDDGPGATEAGALYFIDRALATFDSDKRELYRSGLKEVGAAISRLSPGSADVEGLSREQRREVIRAVQSTEFFAVLREHVVLGFLGDLEYRGNQGKVGWRYIGFDDQMAFTQPFGYYDNPENDPDGKGETR